MQENKKLSSDKGATESIESDFHENELYQINNRSLGNTKKKNDVSMCLNVNI